MIISLVIGNKTHCILSHNLLDLVVSLLNHSLFLGRDKHISQVERKSTTEGLTITHVLNIVEESRRYCITTSGEEVSDDVAERLLAEHLVDVAILGGYHLVEQYATYGSTDAVSLNEMAFAVKYRIAVFVADNLKLCTAILFDIFFFAVAVSQQVAVLIFYDLRKGTVGLDIFELVFTVNFCKSHTYAGIQVNTFLIVGNNHFLRRIELKAFSSYNFALGCTARFGHIVKTKYHILRRYGDRRTIGRVEDVMGREHQQLSLKNCGVAQWHMYSHLVTIEVSVKARTHQRVQTDGFTFNQLGLECLDTQPMQRRSTVEEYRMSFQYVLQNLPHHRLFAVHNTLGRFYGLHKATLEHLADDKRLEQLACHILGKSTFVHFQLGTNHDNRTTGIVDTLTQQVLTETALLSFQRITEGLQGTVRVSLHAAYLTAIVEQRVHRLLQHTLLVAHYNFRSFDLQQLLKTVVADDNTSVELVDVRSGKAAAIQWHQRSQIGRNYGNYLDDHPFRTIVETTGLHLLLRLTERLNHIKSFQSLLFALVGRFLVSLVAKVIRHLVEVKFAQQRVQCFCSHSNYQLVGIVVRQLVVTFGKGLLYYFIIFIGKQVTTFQWFTIECCLSGLYHYITLIIDYLLQLLARNIKKCTYLVGQRAEKPDVGYRNRQFNMAHTLTADFLLGNLHSAAVTDYSFVTDALVLATMTFPIASGTEYALAEQSVTLGLVGTIIDSLGLCNLSVRTFFY